MDAVNRAEELVRQAKERALSCQTDASGKGLQKWAEKEGIQDRLSAAEQAGAGHGATEEQWPDGACGCGVRGVR